jgi:hypothetical protein
MSLAFDKLSATKCRYLACRRVVGVDELSVDELSVDGLSLHLKFHLLMMLELSFTIITCL